MCELNLIPFVADNDTEPFTDWILGLDHIIRKRILVRLARVKMGNFGDFKHINKEIFELRFFFCNGYRVYCGRDMVKT